MRIEWIEWLHYNRIVSCLEFEDCYAFATVKRSWDGTADNRPVNSIMDSIKKLGGEYFALHIGDMLLAEVDPVVVDITGFMSSEDAEFVRNMEEW